MFQLELREFCWEERAESIIKGGGGEDRKETGKVDQQFYWAS